MNIGLFNVTSTMAPVGSAEVGGVEAYTFRLAEALLRRGHKVSLYGGKSETPIALPDIPIKQFPFLETGRVLNLGTRFQRLVQRLHFARQARAELLKENFDAILIFKPYDFVTAWRWKGGITLPPEYINPLRGPPLEMEQGPVRARIVASLHGTEFFPGDRFFSQGVDALFAVSDPLAKRLGERYGRPCEVIPNFVDGRRFALLDRPSPPPEKWIVCAGRMVAIKGMDALVRAFARVRGIIPDARLLLAGDGPERVKLEELVRELNLGTSVKMPGVLGEAQLIEAHRSCHVYAQPSTGDETFSISALEAFASGLSVVASDRVHIAGEFQREGAAATYPSQDESLLEQKLVGALSETWQENRARGRRARALVEAHYTADAVLPRIENLCGNRPLPS